MRYSATRVSHNIRYVSPVRWKRLFRKWHRRIFSSHQNVFVFGSLIGILLAVTVHYWNLGWGATDLDWTVDWNVTIYWWFYSPEKVKYWCYLLYYSNIKRYLPVIYFLNLIVLPISFQVPKLADQLFTSRRFVSPLRFCLRKVVGRVGTPLWNRGSRHWPLQSHASWRE